MASIAEKPTPSSAHKTPLHKTLPHKTLVFGGTGFIGYHIVQQLLQQGAQVRVLTRNPDKHRPLFPDSVEWIAGDLQQLDEHTLHQHLMTVNQLVFAAGVDERSSIEGDAWQFFRNANVVSCEKVFRAAQGTPVTHAVLLSSVFLHAHLQHPELKLAERHPYIASRAEQYAVCQRLADGHFILSTLAIPWVFGTCPHIPSQWSSLIAYVRSANPLLCCRGGVNAVAVQSVAEATGHALHRPTQSSAHAIGDWNLSYAELLTTLARLSGRAHSSVRVVPDRFFEELMHTGALFKKLFNIPSGLDIQYLPELLMRDLFIDNQSSKALLHYRDGMAKQAMVETIRSIPENRYQKNWRKLLNLFSPSSR